MNTDVLVILISVVGAGVMGYFGSMLNKFLSRKKDNAETEGLTLANMKTYIDELKEERKIDRELIKELKRDNEECEYRHDIAQLELQQFKKQTGFQGRPNQKVFILDDNELVIKAFRHRFSKITSIDCEVFTNNDIFLKATQKQQPEILILDYLLGDITADDIIDAIGYEPEIFIMSTDSSVKVKFKETEIRFFEKDIHLRYVFKIAKAVVEHLNDKN